MSNSLLENVQFDYNHSISIALENIPSPYPLHWHTHGEIIWALKDNLLFSIQGQEYYLKKDDILFMWPGELHSTLRAEKDSYLVVHFSNEIFSSFPEMTTLQNSVLAVHHIPGDTPCQTASKISRHMMDIKDTFYSRHPMNNLRMCVSVLHIFLLLNDYCLEMSRVRLAQNSGHHARSIQMISKAGRYIVENCDKALTLDVVAKHVGINKFYFSRIFKEHMGISFCDYLSMQRVQQVILLLEDPDISITEAAFRSGFGSIASFNRSFRKCKNCTPSEYRELLYKSNK